jgi:hypothetical protein
VVAAHTTATPGASQNIPRWIHVTEVARASTSHRFPRTSAERRRRTRGSDSTSGRTAR